MRKKVQQLQMMMWIQDVYKRQGYGFNDSHIQPKLISQIKSGGKPIVVITKKATDECLRLVTDTNVKKYLILEDNGSETRAIFNNEYTNVNCSIWSLKDFMEVW